MVVRMLSRETTYVLQKAMYRFILSMSISPTISPFSSPFWFGRFMWMFMTCFAIICKAFQSKLS